MLKIIIGLLITPAIILLALGMVLIESVERWGRRQLRPWKHRFLAWLEPAVPPPYKVPECSFPYFTRPFARCNGRKIKLSNTARWSMRTRILETVRQPTRFHSRPWLTTRWPQVIRHPYGVRLTPRRAAA